MAINNGQRVEQDTDNAAFLSRTQDSDTIAVVGLNKPAGSGALIPDAQAKINENQGKADQNAIDIASNDVDIAVLQATKQNISEKNVASGYAGLDASGKLDPNQIPDEFTSYEGFYDATTNTPTLVDGTGNIGQWYRVTVAGTQDFGAGNITFAVGEKVIYNPNGEWEKESTADLGSIDGLSDVDTSTTVPTDGQALVWNNTDSEWQPGTIQSQENLAWVPQGTATWDSGTGDLILDTDCFVGLAALSPDFHTVLAQTISLTANGQVAYITIDRAAAAITTRAVTVVAIGSFVNDGNNIIIARRENDEAYIGVHDQQRLSDGDIVDLAKGGNGGLLLNTEDVEDRLIYANANLLPSNLGSGSGSYANYRTQRVGDSLRIRFLYNKDATAGTGATGVEFPLPDSLSAKTYSGTGVAMKSGGVSFGIDHHISQPTGADQYMACGIFLSGSNLKIARMGTGSTISGSLFKSNSQIYVDILVPINGWTSYSAPIPVVTEYLETVYAGGTGNINSPSVYAAPGPSEFDLALTAGTWQVGYHVDIDMRYLTGALANLLCATALHLDGVIVAGTESYGSENVFSGGNNGGVNKFSNVTEITIATAQDLQLKMQTSDSTGTNRIRLISVNWSATMAGQESAPKLWARRIS